MDVGQLWVGFLDFYASWNDEERVVSIRQSAVLTKSEKEWFSPFPCIAIEDPFDLSKNHGAGLSEESESVTSHVMITYLLPVYRNIKETFAKTRDQFRTPPNMKLGLLQVRSDKFSRPNVFMCLRIN